MSAALPEVMPQDLPASTPLRILPIPESGPPALSVVPSPDPTTSRTPSFVQGSLAVDFGQSDQDPFFGPQATSTADLPESRAWVTSMSQAIIEAMAGTRSTAQLVRWMTPEVYAMVVRRAAVATRRGIRPGRRAMVRSVHLCEPADGVLEACAVIVDRGRVRAMALRLTGVDRRWLVTALQLG